MKRKINQWLLAGLAMLLCFGATACGAQSNSAAVNNSEEINTETTAENIAQKQIKITDTNGNTVVFALNDSTAANDLYAQLPLAITVENYSDNEKIFYPNELNTENTPLAQNKIGTLAYYAPWKDVVMFYGEFRQNNNLYELGHVVSGEAEIAALTGEIKIEKIEKAANKQ